MSKKEITFQSPTATPIRVPTTSGHVAMVGPTPRPLPKAYHQAAIIAGCVTNTASVQAKPHTPKAGPDAGKAEDEPTLIRKAIMKLIEQNDAEDFTADNLPKVASVQREAGFNVNKGDVVAVWEQMRAEAKAQAGASDDSVST